MNAQDREARALGFGAAAGAYQRGRPSYPGAALDWLIPGGARDIIDLGASTGKLSAALVGRGLRVTAVEPDVGMLAQLWQSVPDATGILGRAEDIPLPDACADAVIVGQAWHWVNPDLAVPEVARVLRPRGRLALVWNMRDERLDWVARLGVLLRGVGATTETEADPPVGAPFGQLEHATFEWIDRTTARQLVDLVISRSYVMLLSEADRADLLGRVRDLLDTHPDLRGREHIDLPYVADCFRADLPAPT